MSQSQEDDPALLQRIYFCADEATWHVCEKVKLRLNLHEAILDELDRSTLMLFGVKLRSNSFRFFFLHWKKYHMSYTPGYIGRFFYSSVTRCSNIIFLQDGISPHWYPDVQDYLGKRFSNSWIWRDGPIRRPPCVALFARRWIKRLELNANL